MRVKLKSGVVCPVDSYDVKNCRCLVCGKWYNAEDVELLVEAPEPCIKDSGDRTEYSTGAVRDCKKGKGRCDLMPLDALCRLFSSHAFSLEDEEAEDIFDFLYRFKVERDTDFLLFAIGSFWNGDRKKVFNELIEVSKHFEDGAEKYGVNNWQKGIPVHSYIDSAIRHYLKYRAGWTDEPHDRAFVWNLLCCWWTVEHHPEMDDFTEKTES